jgi:hypothetical protein
MPGPEDRNLRTANSNQSDIMTVRPLFILSAAAALGAGCGPALAQSAEPSREEGDPVQFFNLLSQGKDYVDRAELSGLQLSIFDRIAGRLGARTDRITRLDFMAVHEARQAELDGRTISVPAGAHGPVAPPPPSAGAAPGDGGRTTPRDGPDDADQRPVVYRAGKLPEGLPAWFAPLDTDHDGQVGLYEWVRGGRPVEPYRTMDSNGDGLLTMSEVMRHQRLPASTSGKPME